MARMTEVFDAHHNVLDLSKPYSISGNLTLLSSVTSIMSNFLDHKEPEEKDTITELLQVV